MSIGKYCMQQYLRVIGCRWRRWSLLDRRLAGRRQT